MCGVWVALEDATAENGPLEYYPGSQDAAYVEYAELGKLAGAQKRPYEFYNVLEKYWSHLIDIYGWKREEFHCKKGQALIWAADLLHGGSTHIDSKKTRHSQVTHYYFEDCVYYTPLNFDHFHPSGTVRSPINIVTQNVVESQLGGSGLPKFFGDTK